MAVRMIKIIGKFFKRNVNTKNYVRKTNHSEVKTVKEAVPWPKTTIVKNHESKTEDYKVRRFLRWLWRTLKLGISVNIFFEPTGFYYRQRIFAPFNWYLPSDVNVIAETSLVNEEINISTLRAMVALFGTLSQETDT